MSLVSKGRGFGRHDEAGNAVPLRTPGAMHLARCSIPYTFRSTNVNRVPTSSHSPGPSTLTGPAPPLRPLPPLHFLRPIYLIPYLPPVSQSLSSSLSHRHRQGRGGPCPAPQQDPTRAPPSGRQARRWAGRAARASRDRLVGSVVQQAVIPSDRT